MFGEEVDWDVPEHIKNLNKLLFHSPIERKTQAGKRTKKEMCGNEFDSQNFGKLEQSEPQRKKKKKEKKKIKKVMPNSTPQVMETEVDCIAEPGNNGLLKKKQAWSSEKEEKKGSLQKEISATKQPHELLDKQEHKKHKTEQLSSVKPLKTNGSELKTLKILKNVSGSSTTETNDSGSTRTKTTKKRKLVTSNDETVEKKAKSQKTFDIEQVHVPKKPPMDVNRLKAYLNKNNAKQIEPALPEKKGRPTSSQSLGDRMSSQLNAARFRYINEQMYSCTGKEAGEMFDNDKESFVVYHSGFRSQVDKWPVNPVDRMVEYIKHSDKSAVVADFGCGDAKIARSVPNVVHSFDLVALNSHVVACDMRHVALPSSSVDIAVFCLSLMGTNLVEFLCEANRVLKMGSVLLIAEVISRFEKVGKFAKKLQKLGFSLVNKDTDNKMFVWLEFTKTSASPPKDQLPDLQLLPCLYKKR